MAVKIAVIGAYALMIIIVGLYGLRKTKSFSEFFLGGGNVGAWMSAFSYGTTYFSAVLFIGFAGKIGWGFGYSGLWVGILNGLVGVMAVWWLMAWRIKKMSVEYNVSTLSEFLEARYKSPAFKLTGSLAIFVFLVPYSAAVFMGLSYLFTTNFKMDYGWALVFMGVFTAVYIVLGGYKSMAMIDMIFGIIMVVGVVVLFFSTVSKGGGLAAITSGLNHLNPQLTDIIGPPGWWPLFCLVFLTSLAPFAMPQLVQKFYAIKDQKAIKRGMYISTLFALLIGGVAYFTGATTRIFMTPENSPAAFKDGQPLFDRLMPELLTNIIPESLAVVILLLILSASMSTLASLVLISSSSAAKDFYAGFINKKISDASLTRLMRWLNAFFVMLSVLLAWLNLDSIVSILGVSWGALGSFFLGPFIWGLFTKNTNKYAAYAGAFGGLGVCLVLYFTGISSPEAGVIGMLTSLALPALFLPFTARITTPAK